MVVPIGSLPYPNQPLLGIDLQFRLYRHDIAPERSRVTTSQLVDIESRTSSRPVAIVLESH